jgi:hypothetical protein
VDIDVSMISDHPRSTGNNFDLSDMTQYLQTNRPLLNSTPERNVNLGGVNLNEERGNYIHTQRIRIMQTGALEQEGPMSPESIRRCTSRIPPALDTSRNPNL